jgi:PKD repeat protein
MKRILAVLALCLLLVGVASADTDIIPVSGYGTTYNITSTGAAFSDIRNSTGNGATSTITTMMQIRSAPVDAFRYIQRGVLIFDTSGIPDDATINSADVYISSTSKTADLGTPDYLITGYDSYDEISVTANDYNRFIDTDYSNRIGYANIPIHNYVGFNLTVAGIASVNKTGNTTLMIRDSWDRDSSPPTWSAETITTSIGWDSVGNTSYIVINYTPVNSISANFTASNSSGIQPLLVQFTDTSMTVDATIDSWAWDFGDGNISTSQSPSHLYEVPGTHTANLTITNTSYSLVSTKLTTITVYKQPVADFSAWNTAGNAPHTTYLYDTSTNLNPGPYTYYWDMGDGNTSTEQNTYYTWNITGTYTVSHSVTDSITTGWENKTAYVTVGSPETEPVASFYGGPQLGAPPLQVFFTDVSTNTPTGWNWSHGDGTYSIIQNPTHWYNKSGFYTVGLTASNGAGSNTSTQTNFVMVY